MEVIEYLIPAAEDGLVHQPLHACATQMTARAQQVPTASKWDDLEARSHSHGEPFAIEGRPFLLRGRALQFIMCNSLVIH